VKPPQPVAVEQFQISGELFDPVDLAASFDFHND
jgi:hypothetical protein